MPLVSGCFSALPRADSKNLFRCRGVALPAPHFQAPSQTDAIGANRGCHDESFTHPVSSRDTAEYILRVADMRFRDWIHPPRHVLAVFVAVACLSAGVLVWLAWLL